MLEVNKRTLHIDLETRSTVDLRKTGVYVYADDPSTEILIACWAVDDGPVQTWTKFDGNFVPRELYGLLLDPTVMIVAHNSGFERIMLSGAAGKWIGVTVNREDQHRWDCTAARAAAMGLPRTLDGAAKALGLSVEKDAEGSRLMLQMCKPRAPRKGEDPTGIYWFDDSERMARLVQYCKKDVAVERALDKVLPKLSATERKIWETTELMNDGGVTVDTDLLERVSAFIEHAEIRLNKDISDATNGAVPRITDHAALTRWLVEQGIDTDTVAKQWVLDMLETDELDPLVQQVLMYRRDGGGSSAKKYRAIAKRLSADGRLRGGLVYCGAASTGRWSSRGTQLQNLPRADEKKLKSPDDAIDDVLRGTTIDDLAANHGPPLVVASQLLRPVFTASPDYWLARGDYSQIEARVLAWLAGQENVLDAFMAYDRGTGPDLYKVTAAGIYGKPVEEITKAERQIGKVAMLALGYQGGKGAFVNMAAGYGLKDISEERAEEIKLAWRAANPKVVELWYALEAAAVLCMEAKPNIFHPVGDYGVGFKRNAKAMVMRLMSGRHLVYWRPKVEAITTPWGATKRAVTYWAEDPVKKIWTKFTSYGGLLTENLVQAAARDIMAYALTRFPLAGIRPILTVHDEGIGEAPKARFPRAEDAAPAVKKVMEQIPAWAVGLPVSADASAGERYAKG